MKQFTIENSLLANKEAWLASNREAIHSRTAFLRELPQGIVYSKPHSMHQLRLERQQDQLQMYFLGEESTEVLSRINVHDPLVLCHRWNLGSVESRILA